MRKILFFFCPLFLWVTVIKSQAVYQYQIDLNTVKDDRVSVELKVPAQTESHCTIYFPTTIPGTYATLDYGRLITNFKAKDAEGNDLPFEWGGNVFRISNAEKLATISYDVDDSFDAKFSINPIFEPAGTNIEAGSNFLINAGGFFGCFIGQELTAFEVTVLHPDDFYGVTSLTKKEQTTGKTIVTAKDYHELIDNPMMFSQPDTASLQVMNTHIEIGVFHTGDEKLAGEVKKGIEELMTASGKFFGTLPVDHYTYIIYLEDYTEDFKKMKGWFKQFRLMGRFANFGKHNFGALEHGLSSLYHLPYVKEITEPRLQAFGNDLALETTMSEVAVHEFLHILTPLSLHSQQIGNFDYNEPKMSKHLWLYEGSTEYYADIVRLQGGMISEKVYMNGMRRKIASGMGFPFFEMSFTEMSAHVLEPPYSEQYDQVYDYGAVINLMLDIEILRLTDGKKSLKTVLFDLMKKYGKDKSFDDDTFIAEFVAAVHPDLQNFFDRFVSGREQVDFNQLSNIGYMYYPEKDIPLPKSVLEDNDITVQRVDSGYKVKSTGKEEWVGLQKGDIILKGDINKDMYKKGEDYLEEGEKAFVTVSRNGKHEKLEFTIQTKNVQRKFYLEKMTDLAPEQQKLKDAWLGNLH